MVVVLHKLFSIHSLVTLCISIAIAFAAWFVYSRYFHPLAKIPGPFKGSFTRSWYINNVKRGDFDRTIRDLHRKHGHYVRVAPNEVSISDPDALRVIYGSKAKFDKTDFYTVWRASGFATKHADLFTTVDEDTHAQRRKIVNNVYSMSSILDGEKHIDSCTDLFVGRLREYEKAGTVLDLGQWLEMYAFDVIGELFFGQKFGFMETRSDVGNYIESVNILLPVLCTAAVMARGFRTIYLMSGLVSSSIRRALSRLGELDKAAKDLVARREELMRDGSDKGSSRDLLSKLFKLHHEKGVTHDFKLADVQQESYVALVAGSDTTAIAMRSILYNIIKTPRVYGKVMEEIDKALQQGMASLPIRYNDAVKLPYFSACCKEGMRVHPSTALHLARLVPKGGCNMGGYHFPEGYRVGINATALHYERSIFGDDADVFDPDRWFRSDAANMERYMFQFGAGSRSCLGKNIALAEIYKLLPSLLFNFRFELEYPDRPLKTFNFWFHNQKGLLVRVYKR